VIGKTILQYNILEKLGEGTFYQPIPETNKPAYMGKIVVLIDERAISQQKPHVFF